MQSVGMNIAAMFTGVCIDMCVQVYTCVCVCVAWS